MFKVKDTYVSLENILQLNFVAYDDLDFLEIVYIYSDKHIRILLTNGIDEYRYWSDLISEEVNRRLYERS